MDTMILSNAIREGRKGGRSATTGACAHRWTDRVRDLGTGMPAVKQPATSGTPFVGAASGFVAKAAATAETVPGTLVWSPPT